ncbi:MULTISPECIES: 3-methyl-2-oxobutanoate hydroxymethyltransferase [unclassified Pseudactinotalea]|uniref:3-methyl-2-oxobutanoate hydroxymethyltransferase n=1 Tax=unclassified Pseudactinotalea TaxID=2649176 RepID=UPI00128B43E5|nr:MULTISPECIES: 3-methyl-2-oxobutanoate hydroxymethyltransferase [unclassified Pseudactinotalea]MPV50014.1 3-methyl-2-oxobutanoate hydroxymethyltransferase [Pseudactinotalea sp. HY160]QGH69504.1 3-methyl-2-oxobutanoate hydroxymethyltransferase [Pseudactinotalea sp. HY158]
MSKPTAPDASALPPVGGTARVRLHHLRGAKERGERLTMLTAYDAPTARIFDAAGIDLLLVGDSYGDNILGHEGTTPTTMDELVPAARAVARGAQRAMVVVDLPFGSYEASAARALESGIRMVKEAGAHAVKIEGGRRVAAQVLALTQAGIPVVGHLGFTPQSENILGGKRVQGRGDEAAEQLCADALALQEAGAIAIVLEMVPGPVAARVTEILAIPTIGIGAGPGCDGQVLVWLDMAGMGEWSPRFAKQFAHLGALLTEAARDYAAQVRSGSFPGPEHTYER